MTEEWMQQVQNELILTFPIHTYTYQNTPAEVLKNHYREAIKIAIQRILNEPPTDDMIQAFCNRYFGLGCIEALLNDPFITEIMINGPKKIFIERNGFLIKTPLMFESEPELLAIIDKIVTLQGKEFNELSPIVDAILSCGSRFNAIISPIAKSGTTITIRKYLQTIRTSDDLLSTGFLTRQQLLFLKLQIENHKNILISGGTSTGKTTLLSILSQFIPLDERIITIEDTAELKIKHDNWVQLISRDQSIEKKGIINFRELIKNACRMRPDRLLIGETRGIEMLEMLIAMNLGQSGMMTTCHANSTRDALNRIEMMALLANTNMSLKLIKELISKTIQILIHLEKKDSKRVVVEIVNLCGLENDTYVLERIE